MVNYAGTVATWNARNCLGVEWTKDLTREHVETVHSEGVEEAWSKGVLIHPKTPWRSLASRKDLKSPWLPFDSLPWVDRKTQEHPSRNYRRNIFHDNAKARKFQVLLWWMHCHVRMDGEFIADESSLQWNFTMICPIGCGSSLNDFLQVRGHFENAHGTFVGQKQRGSEVTYT